MEISQDKKTVKDSLVDALEDEQEEKIIGKPDYPTLPLNGSENVSISNEEEKEIE